MSEHVSKRIPHPVPAEYREQLMFLGRNCISHYGHGEHRPITDVTAHKAAARELNNYINHLRRTLGVAE